MKTIMKKILTGIVAGVMSCTAVASSTAFADSEEELTREEYEVILSEFNASYEEEGYPEIQMNWDGIYADFSAGTSEENGETYDGKAIPEMSGEEFWSYLAYIHEGMEDLFAQCDTLIDEDGNAHYYKHDELVRLAEECPDVYESILDDLGISQNDVAVFTETTSDTISSIQTSTTLTKQKYYYDTTETTYGSYLWSEFYWVSVDGENRYSSMNSYGSEMLYYPAYRASGCTCSFTDYSRKATCIYSTYLHVSANSFYTGPTVIVQYTAGGGNGKAA